MAVGSSCSYIHCLSLIISYGHYLSNKNSVYVHTQTCSTQVRTQVHFCWTRTWTQNWTNRTQTWKFYQHKVLFQLSSIFWSAPQCCTGQALKWPWLRCHYWSFIHRSAAGCPLPCQYINSTVINMLLKMLSDTEIHSYQLNWTHRFIAWQMTTGHMATGRSLQHTWVKLHWGKPFRLWWGRAAMMAA